MKNLKIILLFLCFSFYTFSIKIENNKYFDDYGNSIQLKKYKRILITDPSCIEIFYLIGAEDKIIGVSKTRINKMWPSDKIKKLESVGTVSKPSIEKILKLNPDLVILNLMSREVEDVLKKQNIPFIVDRSTSFEQIFQKIKIYGKITGNEKNAQNLIDEKNNKLNEIKTQLSKNSKKLRGLILYSTSPLLAYNSKSIPGEILKLFNIQNLGDSYMGNTHIISSDYILKNNPEVIICTMKIKDKESLIKKNNYLKYTDAYKNDKIYIFESSKILRGSPRVIDNLKEIYEVLYK
ncbi:ABC transporter substrate-binding protein [Fusobacterium sp. MFO224]|uniref:ABC transporter substrate-binding protein n=1 Tax=Fusobacterium sp. MFO224 TaxID=3378070 RepID=UPI0038551E07